MWNWGHFKELGWIAHTVRAARLSGLLILAGLAMLLHAVLPFWQQPSWLRAEAIGRALCGCKDCPPEVELEALEVVAPEPEKAAAPATEEAPVKPTSAPRGPKGRRRNRKK